MQHQGKKEKKSKKQIARHRQEEAVGITACIWLTCFSRLPQDLSQMLLLLLHPFAVIVDSSPRPEIGRRRRGGCVR